MKVESRIFEICTVFFFIAAIVYTLLTHEPVGIAALFLTGGLSLIIGTYFRFLSRRLEQRPEDNPDAEVADGAGEVGFFSPHSYWPIGVAFSAAITALGLALFYAWLIAFGVFCILLTVAGLVFEYHVRPSEH